MVVKSTGILGGQGNPLSLCHLIFLKRVWIWKSRALYDMFIFVWCREDAHCGLSWTVPSSLLWGHGQIFPDGPGSLDRPGRQLLSGAFRVLRAVTIHTPRLTQCINQFPGSTDLHETNKHTSAEIVWLWPENSTEPFHTAASICSCCLPTKLWSLFTFEPWCSINRS